MTSVRKIMRREKQRLRRELEEWANENGKPVVEEMWEQILEEDEDNRDDTWALYDDCNYGYDDFDPYWYDDWLWNNNGEGPTIHPGTHLRCKKTGRYYVVTTDDSTVCITTGEYGDYPSLAYFEMVEN